MRLHGRLCLEVPEAQEEVDAQRPQNRLQALAKARRQEHLIFLTVHVLLEAEPTRKLLSKKRLARKRRKWRMRMKTNHLTRCASAWI